MNDSLAKMEVSLELSDLIMNSNSSAVHLGSQKLSRFANDLKARLSEKEALILKIQDSSIDEKNFKKICLKLGLLLGNLMPQNTQQDKVVEVYNRRIGKIKDGVRYHQSQEGGDIHTDSVNDPTKIRYILLGCFSKAALGGESVVIKAQAVYEILTNFPEVLDDLSNPFWFERRGMSSKPEFFQMPILSFEGGMPNFRYLRSYIESAHEKQQSLTSRQEKALDVLDTVLDLSSVRHCFVLDKMEVLIWIDTRVFHGRTRFIDSSNSEKRLMYRVWAN